jgi:hypothetical protein
MSQNDHEHHDEIGDDERGFNLVNFLPHAVTAVIAVCGIGVSLLWTISDLKVRDMEMGTKIVYLESRVQHIEDYLGQRANSTDSDRANLWDEISDIKKSLNSIEEQHNKKELLPRR